MKELDTRWAYDDPAYVHGIAEDFPIDRCTHSVFGASKVAADVMTQEYGRYYGLKTGVFRGGCLTGPQHAGVELHGFLHYLVSVALRQGEYTIYGYKGKQVRDQLHSADVVEAIWAFAQDPRPGEVYNLGGGAENAASLVECIELVAEVAGARAQVTYDEQHRTGDHICYYSDLRKLQSHYPGWRPKRSLAGIIGEIVAFESERTAA
jgi:CDP-paratose 2-epimerase